MFCFANEMLCYTATCILGQLKKRRYQNYTFCQIYNFERGNKIYNIPIAIVVYLLLVKICLFNVFLCKRAKKEEKAGK